MPMPPIEIQSRVSALGVGDACFYFENMQFFLLEKLDKREFHAIVYALTLRKPINQPTIKERIMENTIFQIIRIIKEDGNEIITYEYNTQLEAIRGVQKHIRAMMELDKRDKSDMPNKYGKRFKLDEKEQKILGGIQFQAEAALKEAGNWINPIDGDKFVLNVITSDKVYDKFEDMLDEFEEDFPNDYNNNDFVIF